MAKKQTGKKSKYKTTRGPKAMITRAEYSDYNMYGAEFDTDPFYVGVANKLLRSLESTVGMGNEFSVRILKHTALTLTAYLADLVSGLGVWEAFENLCRKKYGYRIPFDDDETEQALLTDIDPELPKLAAVRFLLWYCLGKEKRDTLLNPHNTFLNIAAMSVTVNLLSAYDEAPETPCRMPLNEDYMPAPLFFQIRQACKSLCKNIYLTRVADLDEITDKIDNNLGEILRNTGADENAIEYATQCFYSFNTLIGPVAVTPQEWLHEILSVALLDEDDPKTLKLTAGLKSLPYKFYKVKSIQSDRAVYEDAGHESYQVSAFTMPNEKMPGHVKKGDTVFGSIVNYGKDWVVNGIALQGLPSKLYKEVEDRAQEDKKRQKSSYDAVLKYLDGKRLIVCRNYDAYLKKFPKPIGQHELSDEEREQMAELNDVDNLLCFLKSDGMVEMIPDYGSCVKIPYNKYYDPTDTDGFMLVMDSNLASEELRDYLVDNKLVPGAAMNSMISKEDGHRLFQTYMRFFCDNKKAGTLRCIEE